MSRYQIPASQVKAALLRTWDKCCSRKNFEERSEEQVYPSYAAMVSAKQPWAPSTGTFYINVLQASLLLKDV